MPGTMLDPPTLNGYYHNGSPLSGGTMEFFVAGTDNPQDTYNDANLLTVNSNPVVLDSEGRANVFLQAAAYKVVVKDSLGSLIRTVDGIVDVGAVNVAAVTRQYARGQVYNLDNGAAVAIDDVIMRLSYAVTISAARVVYVEEVTGTVNTGSIQLGTSQGGADVVAVTLYENSRNPGESTGLTIANGAIPAGTAVHVRHLGVAATQPGRAYIELEFS